MRVAHNIAALTAQKNLHRAQLATMRSVDRLSSGLRITRAADDAAGLGVSESLRADIASLRVATRNANDGISLVQVAEGAYGTISSLFIRMRELATQSASGTLGDEERSLLSVEFEALKDEITRIYKRTEYNGINPLASPSGGVTKGVQVGLHAGDVIDIDLPHICEHCMFKAGYADWLNVDTMPGASEALTRIDRQMLRISKARAGLGAQQNRLEHANRNLEVSIENLVAAESRIRDVDFASESAYLQRNQILMQATIAVLAQANQAPRMALELLS